MGKRGIGQSGIRQTGLGQTGIGQTEATHAVIGDPHQAKTTVKEDTFSEL